MESIEKKNIIFLRLFSDENVNDKLLEACKQYNVKTAIVISGIGQLKKAKVGYFKNKGNYSTKDFNKPMEILSLNGNICKDDYDYVIHLHIVLGDEKKNAIGGHFIEGIVSVTGEIVLLKTDISAKRIEDNKTGLKMISFE